MPRSSKPNVLRRLFRLAIALAILAVAPPLLLHESVRWQGMAAGIVYNPKDAPRADTAIVLGAAVRPDGRPHPVLQARLETTAALFHAGKVTDILVSGGREPYYDEPGAMRRGLQALGVPADRIREDPRGLRTLDSMVRAKTCYGIDHALVVSQAYHLPRALFLGHRLAGLDCTGVAAPQRQRARLWLGIPRREYGARILAWLDVYVLGTKPGD